MSEIERNPEELAGALEQLRRAESLDDVAGTLRKSARRLFGADGVALVLRDGDLCHYVDEDAIGPLWKGQRFPMAACISGWSMQRRQTVCISDIASDRRIPYDLYQNTFVQSLVMTPVGRQAPVGALGAYWSSVHRASSAEVAAVEAVADAAAEAINRVRGLAEAPQAAAGSSDAIA